jgi:hypothetical protein
MIVMFNLPTVLLIAAVCIVVGFVWGYRAGKRIR